jgi:hypothetical protein
MKLIYCILFTKETTLKSEIEKNELGLQLIFQKNRKSYTNLYIFTLIDVLNIMCSAGQFNQLSSIIVPEIVRAGAARKAS